VIGLLQNGAYSKEVRDPVFSAREHMNFVSGTTEWSLWISNTTMGGLGCTEQYQVCGTSDCTALGGFYQITNSTLLAVLDFNENQQAVFQAISYSAWATRIAWTTYLIGDEVLLARDKLSAVNFHMGGLTGSIYTDVALPLSGVYYSAPLDDQQWQLEVEQMHNMALAKMQRILTYRPSPPSADLNITYEGKNFINPPATDAEHRLCFKQKVRNQLYKSFSVFGIIFILVIGLMVMAFRLALPNIVGFVQERRNSKRHGPRFQSWIQMDILHVMSFVLEDDNEGIWGGRDGPVPVMMEEGKMLRWIPRS
jgi:hypothetical protein